MQTKSRVFTRRLLLASSLVVLPSCDRQFEPLCFDIYDIGRCGGSPTLAVLERQERIYVGGFPAEQVDDWVRGTAHMSAGQRILVTVASRRASRASWSSDPLGALAFAPTTTLAAELVAVQPGSAKPSALVEYPDGSGLTVFFDVVDFGRRVTLQSIVVR